MNITAERLAQRLESELGANLVSRESGVLTAHAVDGKTPALVCSPAAPEQVEMVLRGSDSRCKPVGRRHDDQRRQSAA